MNTSCRPPPRNISWLFKSYVILGSKLSCRTGRRAFNNISIRHKVFHSNSNHSIPVGRVDVSKNFRIWHCLWTCQNRESFQSKETFLPFFLFFLKKKNYIYFIIFFKTLKPARSPSAGESPEPVTMEKWGEKTVKFFHRIYFVGPTNRIRFEFWSMIGHTNLDFLGHSLFKSIEERKGHFLKKIANIWLVFVLKSIT